MSEQAEPTRSQQFVGETQPISRKETTLTKQPLDSNC